MATLADAPSYPGGQLGNIKSQLDDLNAQKAALVKFGLNDTNQIEKDATGNYVPKSVAGAVETNPYKLYTNYQNGGGNMDMVAWEKAGRPGGGGNPTVGNLYGGIYAPDANAKALADAQRVTTAGYREGPPSSGDTYTEALNQYQDQIDAINSLYATKRNEVTKQYQDLEKQRMGSEGALLANTGMAGTTFGTSRTAELGIANENELKSAQDKVDEDKRVAIAQLMGSVQTQADKRYQEKLTAYSQGADKTIQYLKESATRNEESLTSVAQNALLKNLDLSDPANFGIVQNIAKTMGVDPSVIIDKYRAAKAVYSQAQIKTKAENEKAAADLAKSIAETGKIPSEIAKTKAETSKIYSDIADGGIYKSGGLKIGKNDLSDIQSVLEKGNVQKGLGGKGNDNFSNTQTYLTLYNYWVNPPNGQGGLAKDFLHLFPPKTYLNPNDPTLPEQLKQALKSQEINITIPGVGQ